MKEKHLIYETHLHFIKQNTSWTTSAIAVTFTFCLMFGLSVYLTNKHHVLGTFKALQNPNIKLTIYNDNFTLSSELGEGSWPWSAIKEIWQYPDTWLVFLTHNSYATFPLTTIPQEIQDIIVGKVQTAGGIIK